jgi:uncharacterized OB-fold protein
MDENVKLYGTALKSSDFKKGKVIITKWKPKAEYTWSAGVAIGYFLNQLKEGKIIGRVCFECNRIMVPPRMFCEECFRPSDEWIEVEDTGTVNTFAISYIATDASRIKTPKLPAVIDLDGATEGMGILHVLGEVDPKKISIGMKVKAVWKPKKDRKGDITDILYFKPLGKAPASSSGSGRRKK